jgi:hypothetical protein
VLGHPWHGGLIKILTDILERDVERPKPRVRKFGRTISVIPTGANGNIGNTGPWL